MGVSITLVFIFIFFKSLLVTSDGMMLLCSEPCVPILNGHLLLFYFIHHATAAKGSNPIKGLKQDHDEHCISNKKKHLCKVIGKILFYY